MILDLEEKSRVCAFWNHSPQLQREGEAPPCQTTWPLPACVFPVHSPGPGLESSHISDSGVERVICTFLF